MTSVAILLTAAATAPISTAESKFFPIDRTNALWVDQLCTSSYPLTPVMPDSAYVTIHCTSKMDSTFDFSFRYLKEALSYIVVQHVKIFLIELGYFQPNHMRLTLNDVELIYNYESLACAFGISASNSTSGPVTVHIVLQEKSPFSKFYDQFFSKGFVTLRSDRMIPEWLSIFEQAKAYLWTQTHSEFIVPYDSKSKENFNIKTLFFESQYPFQFFDSRYLKVLSSDKTKKWIPYLEMISVNATTVLTPSMLTMQLFLFSFRSKRKLREDSDSYNDLDVCFQMIIPFRLLSYVQTHYVTEDPIMFEFVKEIVEMTKPEEHLEKWTSLLYSTRNAQEKRLQRRLFVDICDWIGSNEVILVARPSHITERKRKKKSTSKFTTVIKKPKYQ